MNNIIECKLESTYKEIYTGLWQYDYGQRLRITGVEFPKAVEIQFSLNEKSGSAITRIGTTVDGVTEVQIPDELLKNEGCSRDYTIYAYIYLTDETYGSTEYEIVLHVKSRTKPELPTEEPEPEKEPFHDAINAVNTSAERAESARDSAKESAGQAENALKEVKDTAEKLSGHIEQAEELDSTLTEKIEHGEDIIANIKDKVDSPPNPMVGKYLRVKSVNGQGIPELEWVDVESGNNLDVQIDGESIVKDGVAEIPIAKQYGEYGIFRINTPVYSGLEIGMSAGQSNTLKTSLVGKDYIDRRICLNQPLGVDTLDHAVKCAMCDGKGAAWTEEEQIGAWARQTTIKTTMDDIAIAGAQYYLGELTELTITLSDDALVGQETTIVWYNGAEPANLSIDGNILDFDYVPNANTRSELSCLWDGTYWCLIFNEQSIPTTEVAEDEQA